VGKPVANITLMKGEDVKKVTEKLAVPETEGVYFTTNRPDRGLIRYFY